MKKQKLFFLFAVLIFAAVLLLSGCRETPPADVRPVVAPERTEEKPNRDFNAKIASMTTQEKLAQMTVLSLPDWQTDSAAYPLTTLNSELREALSSRTPGGVILFSPNSVFPAQTLALTDELQSCAGIPFLIGIDQEGGSVLRLAGSTPFGGNMALTAADNTHLTKKVSEAVGSELHSVGILVDFAPVADINSTPANPVIGVRAFSDLPSVTAVQTAAYVSGLHSAGVAATLKHFPGHGDTSADSHSSLPCVNKTLDELRACELIPFAEGIRAGADLVMTAHIRFPKIETETCTAWNGESVTLPATMSKTILTDLLRGELGFEGVIVTDSLQMAAVASSFSPLTAAKYAINAGADLLLMPVTPDSAEGIRDYYCFLDALEALVECGEIDEARLNESVSRILLLKQRLGLINHSGERIVPTVSTATRTARALRTVGSAENRSLAWKSVCRSVTAVKGGDALPIRLSASDTVTVFCPSDRHFALIEQRLTQLRESGQLKGRVRLYVYDGLSDGEVSALIEESRAVILLHGMYSLSDLDLRGEEADTVRFIDRAIVLAREKSVPSVLLCTELPYSAGRFSAADTTVLCYSNAPGTVNVAAALSCILGGDRFAGSLPVDIPAIDSELNFGDILFPREISE